MHADFINLSCYQIQLSRERLNSYQFGDVSLANEIIYLVTDMSETTNETNARRTFFARCFPCGFRDEAIILVKITVPFALGNILSTWLISFISLALVGQARGQVELNACALAMSTYVLIASSLMLGLNFGCDTLLPQCLGGNKRKMGLTVQRAALITGYSCLISWTLLLNAVICFVSLANLSIRFLSRNIY